MIIMILIMIIMIIIIIIGNEAGRDCSGRGNCDYKSGLCQCYKGFHGAACNKQSITY